jgi:hypothetical protein
MWSDEKMTSYFIALVAVMMTIAIVWYKHQPVTPKQATWQDVTAEAKVGVLALFSS